MGLLGVSLIVACGAKGPQGTSDDDDGGATGNGNGNGSSGAGSFVGAGGAGSTAGAGGSNGSQAAVGAGGGTEVPPLVPEFGKTFTAIGSAGDGLNVVRDLEFHPSRPGELWTVNEAIDGTVIYFNTGESAQYSELRIDYFGAHFMAEVSSIAMGDNGNFATCQESRNTWNGAQSPDNFMGPALWPTDLSIYGKANQNDFGLLGSHLDMLHESPNCMGIAHDHDNVYWVFDGMHGNVVRYDFQKPHQVGGDDHSDGIIRVYEDAQVTRVAGVPGHMELDDETGWLYVADTGGGRIIRLDTATGSYSQNLLSSAAEWVDEYSIYSGATVEVFPTSNLMRPSGLVIDGRRMFVSDNASGEVVAYDLDGDGELERLQTPAQNIMGLAVHDGRLWYVDADADEVIRVDP